MYAFSEIILVERSSVNRNERWKRALAAVEVAFPKTHSEWMRKSLKGVRLYLEAALAKRKADPDLLYRAGLGRLAATSGGKPIWQASGWRTSIWSCSELRWIGKNEHTITPTTAFSRS